MDEKNSGSEIRRLALAEAQERFAKKRPHGRALHHKARKWLPGGNTRTVLHHEPFPLSINKAQGAYIWDHDGNRYVDFLNDHTAGLFGHSHEAIIGAAKEALSKGLNGCGNTLTEVEAAILICRRYKSIEKVRFTPSGTEANLMALTLARAATGRNKIVVFSGAYHGLGLLFREHNPDVNLPFEFVIVDYNDMEELERAFAFHAPQIAAILVEPMLGSGGCILAEEVFLHAARRLTRESGALLIFDEVMTSRLSWGGLQTQWSISPDLTTLGKYLAGGFPIGAFGGLNRFMKILDPSHLGSISHNGTFNNNALSMGIAVAALGAYTRKAIRAVNGLGDHLRRRLNQAAQQAKRPLCFSGLGSMLHLHILPSPPSRYLTPKHAEQELRALLYLDLLEDGIRISPKGLISLSCENDEDHCELLAGAFTRFLDKRGALI